MVPPAVSVENTSETLTSKAGLENCRIRSSGVTENIRWKVVQKFATARWGTMTPLGVPVEPEV